MNMDNNEKQLLIQQLVELKEQHQNLDLAIHELAEKLSINQLEVGRLKKQKLKLKDAISRLESNLIPDLRA